MSTPSRRRFVWLAALVGLIAGGIALWTEVIRDRVIAKRWGVVEEGHIYRSGQVSRHLIESQLKEHGIRVVVDLMGDDPGNREQPYERAVIERLGIELVKCPLIGDGTDHAVPVALRYGQGLSLPIIKGETHGRMLLPASELLGHLIGGLVRSFEREAGEGREDATEGVEYQA